MADGALMASVSAGCAESFVDFYNHYCDRAYRVAHSVCHDDGLAQEAVQDGFLSVWISRANYCPQRGSVAAWLLTVVRRRAIDVARRDRRHASRRAGENLSLALSSVDDPLEIAVKRDDAQRLRASVATLPRPQAEVITLAYYGQLTQTEIAGHLALPAGTVKGRMRLGLQKLQADIEKTAA